MLLAERLKTARTDRGYTLGKLSQLSGVHEKAIFKYERGTILPSAENIRKLAIALKISADYFLFEHAAMSGIPKVDDPTLYERYLILEKLEEEDRKAALTLVDSLIARRQLKLLAQKV